MPIDERPLPSPSSRSLLLTVLGELVYPDGKPVWTTALVQVLNGMGVEDHAARQAISRSASAGWINGEKHGRTVQWSLAPRGRELVEDGIRRSASFLQDPEPWDGRWLILLVTIPQDQRAIRKKLYGGLSWLGMGNPSPGVWVTPHTEVVDELRILVAGLGLGSSAFAFVGETRDVGLTDDEIVERSWDLSGLALRYDALIEQFAGNSPADGDSLLLAHLELLNDLQRFIRLDPRLPKELLPEWNGREAATLIRRLRHRWAPLARKRWREIVAEVSPAAR